MSNSLWIESHTDLSQNRRFRRLIRLLAPSLGTPQETTEKLLGMGLHFLWHRVLEQSPEGDVTDWTDEDLADAARWIETDPASWAGGLRSSGLLEQVDGRTVVHDWRDYAGKYLEKKEKERLRSAERRRADSYISPSDDQRSTNGRPAADPGRPLLKHTGTGTGPNQLLPGLADSARVRAHEMDAQVVVEDDDFMATLNDTDDEPITTRADEVPEPDHPPVPEPIPLAKRKARPASADELEELERHWRRAFAEAGFSDSFVPTWSRLTENYPRASGQKLNDWLYEELERLKKLRLPDAVGASVSRRVAVAANGYHQGPRAGRYYNPDEPHALGIQSIVLGAEE